MSVIQAWCDPCKQACPHASEGMTLVCGRCGLVRQVDEAFLLAALAVASMPPVQDMRFCPWCRETREVGHDCPAGAVGCTERQPDETPCGGCGACVAAMTADLRRKEHSHADGPYGSPSDIDTPWSST